MSEMTQEPALAAAISTSPSSTRSSLKRRVKTSTRWSRCCSRWTWRHADDEELNAIFRCAHSIKGGAATFGFADVAELTHQMESLLDKLRRHELANHAAHGGRAAGIIRRPQAAAGPPFGQGRGAARHAGAGGPHQRAGAQAVAPPQPMRLPRPLHPWPRPGGAAPAPMPAPAPARPKPPAGQRAAGNPHRPAGQPVAGRQHCRTVPRHQRSWAASKPCPATWTTSASTRCRPPPATAT